MAEQIGRLVKVGLGRETSRGVGVSPAIWIPQTSIALAARAEEARVEGALGSLADSEDKLVTEQYADGELGGEVRSQSIGFLLYALLGSLSTSADDPVADAHTHSFSLSESNQHTSLSIAIKDENLDELYKLAMLNSLEFSVELGGLVMFSADIISKVPVSSSQTYSRPTDYPFSKKHVTVKIADNLASLSGASALDLKSFTLTFNKNVERDSAIGTAEPVDIFNTQLAVEGSFNLNFTDNTYRDYMLDGNTKAMEVKFNNTDEAITGSTRPSLTFQFPKVDFSGWDADRSLNEILTQSIDFKANYDATNGIISTCDLINGLASY